MENNFDLKIIHNYLDLDEKKKKIDKEHKKLNKEVKNLLERENIEELEDDDFKLTNKLVERNSINEEKLLRLLDNLIDNNLIEEDEVIETTRKPNTDKVEELIMQGKLDSKLLVDCLESSSYYRLSIKRRK